MQLVQALTGRGGWPMSVWCTPDGRPFYAGTYFPDSDRHGMPSFRRVCEAVADAWRERRAEVMAQGEQLTAALSEEVLHAGANGDGEVSMVLILKTGAEVEVKLPGRFKVSPQIAGAIKAVPGVVQVEAI